MTAQPSWREVDWPRHLRRAEIHGSTVNYVDIGEGEGEPVVFVHGLGGQWQNWLENIPRVARERRVIALDLPGFGRSAMPREEITIRNYARTVEALCQQLGLGRIALVGNSMGGFVSAEVVIDYPGRVERLVLVSAAGISSANVHRAPTLLTGRVAAAIVAYTAARQCQMAHRPVTRRPDPAGKAVGQIAPGQLAPGGRRGEGGTGQVPGVGAAGKPGEGFLPGCLEVGFPKPDLVNSIIVCTCKQDEYEDTQNRRLE